MTCRSVTFVLCLAMTVQLQARVQVTLKAEARVRGLAVTLGEVAEIEDGGELAARLSGLELARSPRAEVTVTLTRGRILASLARENLQDEVVLGGAEAVVVNTELVGLARSELNSTASSYVRGRLGRAFEEVEITPRGAKQDLRLPAGLVGLKVIPPSAERLAGMVLVPVEVSVDGEPYKVVPVTLFIKLHQPVVVALSSLRRQDPITKRDVGLERRDVTRSEGKYFTKLEQVVGKKARSGIRAGEIVSPLAVEIAAVIKRRQKVTMIYRSGNVEVTVRGRALADGRPGEIIPVLNIASGAKLEARVLDAKTVEIVK